MRLSVIVTIVDGGAALERCLKALATQDLPPELEVVIPWDDSAPGIQALEAQFPAFQFLSLGHVDTARPKDSPTGQHELFDRRRAAGLAAASGDVIAILEDRGVPRRDWARVITGLHADLPHAVIGGAIENGRDTPLNWAVYFCDFGRYQRPFAAGPRAYVSDVNIAYKRRALDLTAEAWRSRYHETTVHWMLERAGEVLYLSPDPAVDQHRDGLRLGALIGERFAWGRLFAYTRAREHRLRALPLAAAAPLLPFLLFARHARREAASLQTFRRFLRAAPAVFLLLSAWSLGEAVGYVTARP